MDIVRSKPCLKPSILWFLTANFVLAVSITIGAKPTPPVRTMQVPVITEIPIIDGLMNEAHWSAEQSTELYPWAYRYNLEWDGPEDLSCIFHLAWGHSHLYIFVEITDDIDHSWNGTDGNQWEFDNMELFLQLDTNTVITSYDSTTIQIRFCRGITGWSALPGRAEQEEYALYYENTAGGWLIESAIPWTCALPYGSIPEDITDYLPVLGFDIIVTDSDNRDGNELIGSAESEVAWDEDDLGPPSDIPEWPYLWNNTAIFGYINLVGDPVTYLPENLNENKILKIYPNPAYDWIRIGNCLKNESLSIFDISGTKVLELQNYHSEIIDVSYLRPGIYIVRSGEMLVSKFTKLEYSPEIN